MSKGTPASRPASSRPLAGFRVATISRGLVAAWLRAGLEAEDALRPRVERLTLERNEPVDALLGEREQLVEARATERDLLGGPLHLHELAGARHHHVHADLSRGSLGVVEIKHGLALHDTDTHRRHAVTNGRLAIHAGDPTNGVGDGHETAGDGGRAGAAVGLDHVAVHPDRTLSELAAIDDGAKGPADQALDLLRAAAGPTVFALRPGVGRAGQHAVLGGHPPFALALEKRRDFVFDGGRADHLGGAEFDQHGALGMQEIVSRHHRGTKLVEAATVGAGHRLQRAAARVRWSWSRLYSARPAKIARAISSRDRESLSRCSSRGLVTKPIASKTAGMAAPPST